MNRMLRLDIKQSNDFNAKNKTEFELWFFRIWIIDYITAAFVDSSLLGLYKFRIILCFSYFIITHIIYPYFIIYYS